MADRRVVVVGGGVIGVCCAYFLAREGADVTLMERDEIGGAASFGNAGTIAPGHPPLNKPGRIRRSLLELLNPKSPLYIPVQWDPGLFRWLWDVPDVLHRPPPFGEHGCVGTARACLSGPVRRSGHIRESCL